jgi:hypothetical protein
MSFRYCQHVRENGTFCGSGAVKGRSYCYFHLRTRARRLALAQADSQHKPWRPELPPLDDMHAVQVSLMQVADAVASDAIDPRRAGLMLYALRQAALNLRNRTAWFMSSPFKIDSEEEGAVDSYPGLEAEFGLPRRIDLDARPEDVFPAPVPQAEPSSSLRGTQPPHDARAPKKPVKGVPRSRTELAEARR